MKMEEKNKIIKFMEESGTSILELANRSGIPIKNIAQIICDHKPMTPDIALELSNVHGDYDMWMAI